MRSTARCSTASDVRPPCSVRWASPSSGPTCRTARRPSPTPTGGRVTTTTSTTSPGSAGRWWSSPPPATPRSVTGTSGTSCTPRRPTTAARPGSRVPHPLRARRGGRARRRGLGPLVGAHGAHGRQPDPGVRDRPRTPRDAGVPRCGGTRSSAAQRRPGPPAGLPVPRLPPPLEGPAGRGAGKPGHRLTRWLDRPVGTRGPAACDHPHRAFAFTSSFVASRHPRVVPAPRRSPSPRSSACGDDPGPDDSTLSAAGRRGKQVANDNGCAACHSTSGSKSTGPTWKGLAGSTVELADGSR